MNKIYDELMKLNEKAIKKNEIPVSAIILKNGKIIAKAHNKKNSSNCIFDHAEVIAIKKASKKLKTWILDECVMVVTLEPCPMCREIIKQSRIKAVNYFLGNKKVINYKTKFNKIENKEQEKTLEKQLKKFFLNMR